MNFSPLPFAALAFAGVTSISCYLSKLLFPKWREGTSNVMPGPQPGQLSFQISQGLRAAGASGRLGREGASQ